MTPPRITVSAVVEMPGGEIDPDYFVGEFDGPLTCREVQQLLLDNYDVGTVLKVINDTIPESKQVPPPAEPPADTRTNRDAYGKAKQID